LSLPGTEEKTPGDGALGVDKLRRQWTKLADANPYWAVLTDRGKRAGRDPEEFFESGRAEVQEVFQHLASFGVAMGTEEALDFGCGLGRITQALSTHFERVTGTDISTRMVEQARLLNQAMNPNHGRCSFVPNAGPELRGIDDRAFDLVYSTRVLQHMPPSLALAYLRSVAGKLRAGGVMVVQLPAGPSRHPKGLVVRLCPEWLLDRARRMEMHGIPRPQVETLLEQSGCQILDVVRDRAAGPGWISLRYHALRET
jgi:SAM-dependent methyltransferase